MTAADDARSWNRARLPGEREFTGLPTRAGVFEWRVPHAFLDGLEIAFLAHMRMRGGCSDDFLFPAFDHWNGWNATLPSGVRWREAVEPPEMRTHEYRRVRPLGVRPEPCPFCARTPVFAANEGGGRGVVIGGVPHRYDNWTLQCCGWVRTPAYRDPRDLVEARRLLLAAASGPRPQDQGHEAGDAIPILG